MHMFYIDYIPCVDCTYVVVRAWIESAKPRNGLWPSWYVAWIKISLADSSSYHIDKQTVGESALPVLLYINPKLLLFSESITFTFEIYKQWDFREVFYFGLYTNLGYNQELDDV